MKKTIVFHIIMAVLLFSCGISEKNVLVYPELEPLGVAIPELYEELLLLPDLQRDSVENREALKKIVDLALRPENQGAIQMMLSEGNPEYRQYCTPLEALLWLAYDWDFTQFNPLEDYSLETLLILAWTSSSLSNSFSSEPWKDFQEVTHRLNSPNIIGIYMQRSFNWSYRQGEWEGIRSAKQIYHRGTGACYDHALLVTYLLRQNGYHNAWPVVVEFDQIRETNSYRYSGHVGMVFQDLQNQQYFVMDSNLRGGPPAGPFTSMEGAAEDICRLGGGSGLEAYKVYNISLLTGRYIKMWPYL